MMATIKKTDVVVQMTKDVDLSFFYKMAQLLSTSNGGCRVKIFRVSGEKIVTLKIVREYESGILV
jgi:hypothetical protein